MQGLITHLNGDYLYAKKTYNVKGNYFYCLIYLSNVFGNYNFEKRVNKEIKIQVGNSADFSNNHLEIFEKLRNVKDNNIKIVCPLSYGENNKYTKKVIEKGKHIFGKKFIPILEYLPFKEYLKLLSEIDIAIFNHDRQQAMGNIITLIGLGKKVYLRDDISTWNSLNEINLKVFSFNNSDFSLELLRKEEIIENNLIINRNYSESKLIEQWQKIFNN